MAAHNLNDEKPRTADVFFDASLRFDMMPLSATVKQALARNNFLNPSPIQARAIPLARCDFDLLVQAKAGTGKTLVFAVTIVESHLPEVGFPQSLTIAPTREIAVQIEGVLNRIGADVPNFKARSFIGGMEISVDRKNLQNCSAVVGTPGRLLHLIKSNVLNTSHIRTLVLDEADTLLDMRKDINSIVAALPEKRQTLVCSATFYNNRDRELLRYMNEKFIGVTPKREVPMLYGIKQFVRELPEESDNVKDLLAKVASMGQLFRQIVFTQAVVFANTTAKAETYCNYLRKGGWPADMINGGMEQRSRLKAMDDFRALRARVLVATNVIARGIDVEAVNLVVNAEVPKDHATYLHRIGRAGRFGTNGIAVTLVSGVKDMERFRRILHDIGGNEMFVYRMPSQDTMEHIWQFATYGDRYEKLFASQMEQEIRDRDADQLFLKAMKMLDATHEVAAAVGEKIANAPSAGQRVNNNEDTKLDDSLEKSTSDEETVVEVSATEGQETTVVNGKRNGHTGEMNGNVSAPSCAVDDMTVSMGNLSLERPQPGGTGTGTTKLDSVNGNRKANGKADESLDAEPANGATDNDDDDDDDDSSSAPSPKPGPSRNGMKVSTVCATEVNNGLMLAVPTITSPETIVLGLEQLTVNEFAADSDGESSSSSLSTNVTEKVEVGSDFNAPLARLNQIPDPRAVRQMRSVDCSDLEHSSDSESNVNECPAFESNNDALFAKIMEQKELSVEQQEHQVQLHSIDGCSLEVHDDTISDRELSRKGSVPDVVPSGISLDPSRLHNRTTAEEHAEILLGHERRSVAELELEGEEIELNSNTCGSNRGSLFEEEEEDDVEDVIQAKIPKRIRFQQQDSLELNSNTVGSNVGSTPEPPEMLDQPLLPLPIPIEAVPNDEPHDDMDDASSYSSEYDSDGSNSSFFDDVDRISVTSAKSTPKETANELMGGGGGAGGTSAALVTAGSLEQIVASNSVSVAPSPLFVSASVGAAGGPGSTPGPATIPIAPVIVGGAPEEDISGPQFVQMESAGPFPAHSSHIVRQRTRTPVSPDAQATAAYHRTYALWSNQYWNQLTQINDYVRFASYTRRNTYRSP
ncbi:probable ATP-dependent RNA helicase DDX20 [Anopheles cruzii]|uniref:probable ATP-dependent RNA helicase DDX20 n=1 Tax=Anopheles cruzii TaxID=68878 RepID=UPI0022EC2002|nr:probable ATP-dependent RNA helicase DDX20 [Anopheles cruzii]